MCERKGALGTIIAFTMLETYLDGKLLEPVLLRSYRRSQKYQIKLTPCIGNRELREIFNAIDLGLSNNSLSVKYILRCEC